MTINKVNTQSFLIPNTNTGLTSIQSKNVNDNDGIIKWKTPADEVKKKSVNECAFASVVTTLLTLYFKLVKKNPNLTLKRSLLLISGSGLFVGLTEAIFNMKIIDTAKAITAKFQNK